MARLKAMAARYSTAAVAMGHNALTRAIRHTEAQDLVRRNVATGQAGRPGESLTMGQASAPLAAAEGTRMHAYIAPAPGHRHPDREGEGAAVGAR
jgi:hypothetical protein